VLRVLEEKVVERVGDNRPIHINVRIISATNRNLKKLVEEATFREDLFYRINVIPIYVPPLRQRVGDIPLLAESFFHRIQLKNAKKIEGISNEAMEQLMTYPWPGNVRELKSAFEYAFVSCQQAMIQPYHLPPTIFHGKTPKAPLKINRLSREATQKTELVDALEKCGGNQSRAAEMLGISRVTIWNRMKRFGITVNRNTGEQKLA